MQNRKKPYNQKEKAMETRDAWDARLQALIRASDRFLKLEQLRERIAPASLKTLTRMLWIYHVIMALVMIINVPRPILSDPMLLLAGLPLVLCWGIYVAHYVLINLPAHMFSDLYMFFRHRNLEPFKALAAAILVLMVAFSAVIFEFWIS
jgi:hypothetical protein